MSGVIVGTRQHMEVEVRTLAGESWIVVPSGDRVRDLRASLIAAAPDVGSDSSAFFVAGIRYDKDAARLPSPPNGRRLEVHVATEIKPESPPDSPRPKIEEPATVVKRSSSEDGTPEPEIERRSARRGFAAVTAALVVVSLCAGISAGILATKHKPPPRPRERWPPVRGHYVPPDARGKIAAAGATGILTPPIATRLYDCLSNLTTTPSPQARHTNNKKSKPTTITTSSGNKLTINKNQNLPPAAARPLLFGTRLLHATLAASNNLTANDTSKESLTTRVRDALSTIYEELPTTPPAPVVAERPKWQEQLLHAATMNKLPIEQQVGAAAIALFRPIGKRLLAIIMVLVQRIAPAKRCQALVKWVERKGLVPKGLDKRLLSCGGEEVKEEQRFESTEQFEFED